MHQTDHCRLTLISKKLTSVSISVKTKLHHKYVMIIIIHENVLLWLLLFFIFYIYFFNFMFLLLKRVKSTQTICNWWCREPCVNFDIYDNSGEKYWSVISWILNIVSEQISNNLNFINYVSNLWLEVQEHYSQRHQIY